jgi:hypothetical protein
MEGALGTLMTDMAERFVEDERQPLQPVSLRERRGDE